MNEPKRGIEPWQQEDAARLRGIFEAKKAEAKRQGERLTQESFAESSGIASPNMVWQYLAGHRPLNIKAASAFAKGLGVSVGDFSPTWAAQISAAAQVAAPSATPGDGYSLSIEKLMLINAINETEAAILRRYRMADAHSARLIEIAAGVSRPRGLGVVSNDQTEQGPARAS